MSIPRRKVRTVASFFSSACFAAGLLAADPGSANWPRMRGPDGTGAVPAGTSVPVKWDESSVVWKTPIKGVGQSSPVIWGDRIFLTTSLEDGRERLVLCVDKNNGKVLWEQSAWKGAPEKTHKMNGFATPTCVTDGQHVWAWFGKGGAHCYTVDGKHVWSRKDLGEFQAKNGRGVASSAVLVGDILALNGDSDSDPFFFGLDKTTGKTTWKADRPKDEGFSTPIVVTVNGKQELVLNGASFIAAYDPANGRQLWQCKSFAGRGEPMPAVGKDNLLLVVNGLAGDVYAVRPGGNGDVTKSHMAWHTKRNDGRDEPSPLVVGDLLLVSNMQGALTCYDVNSGKQLWREKIVQKDQITAAPIAAGGKAYFTFESGETVVVEPTADKCNIVARNTVNPSSGELFRSSLAPVDGKVYLRSDRVLYCIK